MGWRGFIDRTYHRPINLTKEFVDSIHLEGGSAIGTSCTAEIIPPEEVVKRLDLWMIDMLFVIGGMGSHWVALEVQKECDKNNAPCCVICLPKSLDNDLVLVRGTSDEISMS